MNTYPADVFATYPTVCAVGNEYQIMVPVLKETLMWVEVGGRMYYDDANGILRSATSVHRMTMPQSVLNEARSYTIHYREVFERLPYRSRVGEEMTVTYSFRPVSPDAGRVCIYHVADTHSSIELPVRAGGFWGEDLDFLVMNGDIPDHCGTIENIASALQVCGGITKGGVAMVFSRGNHDLRGVLAEKYAENTPSRNGKTYYTFRLGPIWGIVMDCGEDKVDDHVEYGHTICCHDFRLRETEYLRQIADDPEHEYAADGVKCRMVIAHNPFTQTLTPPFDIEQDIFREWCRILKERIKPDMMLCGHIHSNYVTRPGEKLDHKGQPCPVVVASMIRENFYSGCALEWTPGRMKIMFTDQDHNILGGDELIFS